MDKNLVLTELLGSTDPEGLLKEIDAAIAEFKVRQTQELILQEKAERLDKIFTGFLDYVEDYYPEFYTKELRDYDKTLMVKVIDEAIDEVKTQLNPFLSFNGEFNVNKNDYKAAEEEDPIMAFLKKHNL